MSQTEGLTAMTQEPLVEPPIQVPLKRIMYYAPTDLQFRRWMADSTRSENCTILDERYPPMFRYNNVRMSWISEHTPEGAMERLKTTYAHLVLLDLRWAPEPDDMLEGIRQARRLLTMLDGVEDMESRYGFHRIAAMVSGPNQEMIDQLMVELGGYGVRHVLRMRTIREDATPTEDEAVRFSEKTLDHITSLLLAPRRRRTALCLAGGGITGIYYEMGGLKCLDDCLSPSDGRMPRVNEFDMYFGISAGAVNCGILTGGFAVEEFMASIDGREGGRVPPINLNLLKMQHLNVLGFAKRLRQSLRTTWSNVLGTTQSSSPQMNLDTAMVAYGEVMGPPFHSGAFEKIIANVLSMSGATNDFRRLPRELFIGATDQDLKRHILFGSEGFDQVPISQAIQASLSIHPAFSSVKINGRYYNDGAVTRTNNYAEAVRRGASLVFVFDPFLPYVSRHTGYTSSRGLLYNLDQDIRTLSYTRYENVRNWVLRKHPDVSSYTFVPSNRLRHLLSHNPMDHRPYLEIWKGAYLSTFRRIENLQHRMRGDLAAHGIRLELDKAKAVKERLERSKQLKLEDFFPDGRVLIRHPPLSRQQTPRLTTNPFSIEDP